MNKKLFNLTIISFILFPLLLLFEVEAYADWTKMDSNTEEDLLAISGSSENDVFAVGTEGTVILYDGNPGKIWKAFESDTKEDLNAVYGGSDKGIFAVGNSGTIRYWKEKSKPGSKPTIKKDNQTSENLFGVWRISPTIVFAVGGNGTILRSNDGGNNWKPVEIKKYWSGRAYILWKNLFSYQGTIPLTSPKDSIIALKMHLHDMGYDQIKINPVYDDQTKEAVKNIQKKYGLKADGLVGPLTKIVLYNEKKSLNIPHITN